MQALLVVAALASSFAAPLPAPAAPASSASASAFAAQDGPIDRDKFLKDFRKAMEIKSKTEMANIVRRNQRTATIIIIEICEQIARETNERLETEIAALQDAWTDAFSSRFATITYEYFSLMRLQVRSFRAQKVNDFDKVMREYNAAIESRNWMHLDVACDTLKQLAEAFSNAGDRYYESECWYRVGLAFDAPTRGKDADLKAAGTAFKEAYDAREAIELRDWLHSGARTRSDQLLGERKVQEKKAEADASEGFTRQLAGVSLGPEEVHDLQFELIENIDETMRPGYANHELPTVWRALNFSGPESKASFATFPDGPEATRGGGSIKLDVDRNGTFETEIPLTGNIEPVEMSIGSGDNVRKWGVIATVLTQQEQYQGIGISLEPSESSLSLYVAAGASMVGQLNGTPLRVIDESMDGVYGSVPTVWGYVGLTEGHREPVFDTVVVGGAKRAVPWSEYQVVGGQWYQLTPDQFGTRLKAAPAKVETGTLKLSYKGEEPLYLIVRGSGTFQNSYFDVLANGKKGVEVPAGSYTLFCGELRKGRRAQVMKALILPGSSTKSWTVDPGVTTTIELGEPYDFDYVATEDGGDVKIVGASVVVVGKAGERYERLWNCGVEPDVFMRRVGTKKSGKSSGMERIRDYDSISNHGFAVAWFPLDLAMSKKSESEEVELQFVEKKNKLFGTIESGWRAVSK
jgi:hypothetical protein